MSTADDNVIDAAEMFAKAKKLEPTITQDGIARVFAEKYGDKLRFDHTSSCWYRWDGTRWKKDETNLAFEYVRCIARDSSEGAEEKVIKEMRRVSFASGVERFCRSDPAFAVTADQWDRIPYLIGTPGGTVELTNGTLRPSEPIEMMTKSTAVAPADRADCPTWMRVLGEATNHNAGMMRFLQQWAGYCLTGSTDEQQLVFIHGDGGNGKGVFLRTIAGIMGDYAKVASMDTFVAAKGDRHSADQAMLCGARLVWASETEKGRNWAENRIKTMTGGDPVTCNFMRQNYFTYLPQFKLTFIGNDAPTLSNIDAAIRRRFNVVPFVHKPKEPDHSLERKLKREWPGIFRWMIEGCLDWMKSGLIRPASVVDATEEYFAEQDIVGHWLAECCEVEIGNTVMRTKSSQLHQSYSKFSIAAGKKPESQTAFVDTLKTRGFERYKTNESRGFLGIRLKQEG
jgi:putative DNA primase/helicase